MIIPPGNYLFDNAWRDFGNKKLVLAEYGLHSLGTCDACLSKNFASEKVSVTRFVQKIQMVKKGG